MGPCAASWTTHKITGAKETIASLASKFGTTPDVIRQANNIPPQMRLKAGSTILVPKTSTSTAADIAENIIDNAQIALEADRGESKRKGQKLSGAQRFKASAAHAVAEIKNRVSGGSKPSARANGRKHR